jgi:hypothetical protein
VPRVLVVVGGKQQLKILVGETHPEQLEVREALMDAVPDALPGVALCTIREFFFTTEELSVRGG